MEDVEETYPVEVKCANCGWEGTMNIAKGTPVEETPCSECGVEALKTKTLE